MKLSKDKARANWRKRFENRTVADVPQAGRLEVRAADGVTEMLLFDEIGPWGVTAKQFAEQLNAITTPKIRLRINSPGGDVFDGLAIHAALKAHKATVECIIEGLAASAASFIACAGDTVSIDENSMVMIHQAWGFAIGNKTDMRALADILEKIDGQLVAIYAKKTGKSADEMMALMAGDTDGTWFTAAEAGEIGLVDEIIGEEEEESEEDAKASQKPQITDADRARIQAQRRRLALAEVELV